MRKIIKLQTHDGSNNYLEQIKGHKYKLVTELDFLRGGWIDRNRKFIDPSGGPMLIEGDKIDGTNFTIKSIDGVNIELC